MTERPSLTHFLVEAALAKPPLASLVSAGLPVLLIGGEPFEALWANPAAFSMFRASDLAGLTERALMSAEPGARRLRATVAALEPGSARIERLRYATPEESDQVLTWRCERIDGAGRLVSATALDWTPPMTNVPQPSEERTNPVGQPPLAVYDQAPNNMSPGAPSDSAESTARELRVRMDNRFPGAKNLRFTWRTDANNCISAVSGPIGEVLHVDAAALIGCEFSKLADDLGIDPEGRLRKALHGRAIWTGVETFWPAAGASAVLPVSLGAAPAFDKRRNFLGWRGFGSIDLLRPQAMREPELRSAVEGATEAPSLAAELTAAAAASLPAAADDAAGHSSKEAPSFSAHNVVELRPSGTHPRTGSGLTERDLEGLSSSERLAFREIALALASGSPKTEDGAHTQGDSASPVDPEQAEKRPREASNEPIFSTSILPDEQIGESAMAVFAGSALGLLVSRGSDALWMNQTFLESLGFADREQFQKSGGLARAVRGRNLEDLSPEAASGDIPLISSTGAVTIMECASHAIAWAGAPATMTIFRPFHERAGQARLKTLEMEVRRREAEARELHSILDTATDGVAVLDDGGRLLSLNKAGEALFGFDQNEVAGEQFTILLANESHPAALDYFAQIATNGVASLLNDGREVIGRARRGGSIPIFMTFGRLNVGGAQKFCAVLHDLTAWKKAEGDINEARREAERASALKSDFLAKVSHEIRTPLNAILGFAEVIMEERFGPIGNERYKEYLRDVHASGTHVMSLVNDLLDLSKIEAGKMDLNFDSVDPNKIVSECVSLMQPQANSERVIVRLSLASRLPHVMADERSLRQIVLNLLSNAVKFNEPGGQVIVSTALTDAGHAVIRIRDTGIGMSESELVTALEPFRQVQTSRQTSGTGLGLPLTKALVEANRANFTVKSRKNEGTLVEVAFPPSRVMAD